MEGQSSKKVRYHIFISYTHTGGPRASKYKGLISLLSKRPWKYIAFCGKLANKLNQSYDYKEARHIEKKIKSYKFPKDIKSKEEYKHLKDLEKITVFRDETELQSGELEEQVKKELERSQHLVVISSLHSKEKKWISKEVSYFLEKKERNTNYVTPYVIDGIPYASWRNATVEKECLPAPLIEICQEKDEQEPEKDHTKICPEKSTDSFDKRFIRIITNVFDVSFDDLWKSERRRKRRRCLLTGLFVLLFLACVGWMYWQKFMIHTEYYTKTIDRYGVPVGIHRLKESEINYYLSYYKLEKRDGKVIRAQCLDHNNMLIKIENRQGLCEILEYPDLIREFDYNDQTGKLVSVNLKNERNQYIYRLIYHSDSLIEQRKNPNIGGEAYNVRNKSGNKSNYNCFKTKLNERGEVTQIYIFQNSKNNTVEPETPSMRMIRDDAGRITEMIISNTASYSLLYTANCAIAKVLCKYDHNSCSTYYCHYDANGNPTVGEDWISQVEVRGQGSNHIELIYKDPQGNATLSSDLIAKSTIDISKEKDCVASVVKYFDTKGMRTIDKDNISMTESFVYSNGRNVSRFYDKENRPIYSKEDCHMVIQENRGDTLVTQYFDSDGKICNNYALGYATKKESVINRHETIEFFNEQGERCVSKEDKVAIIKTINNDKGQLAEVRYFATDEKPMLGAEGTPVVKTKYDEQGNITEIRFEDSNGNLFMTSLNYAISRSKYDSSGNCVLYSYFDKSGNPCNYKQMEYSENGQLVRETDCDGQGNLMDGACYTEYTYDKWGNVIEVVYKDKNKNLHVNNTYAIMRYCYSADGLFLLSITYFDVQQAPCKDIDGIHAIYFKYNGRGKVIEEICRGVNNEPVPNHEGGTCTKVEYNECDLIVEKNTFDERVDYSVTHKFIYNERGEVLEDHLSANGNPERITVYEEDDTKRIRIYKNLAPDRSLLQSDDIPAIEKVVYNAAHLRVSSTFYNHHHKLFYYRPDGYAYRRIDIDEGTCYNYNADSVLTSIEFVKYNSEGILERYATKIGIAKIVYEYPSDNIEIEKCYNAAGVLTKALDGRAIVKKIFNSNGYLLQQNYYDELGNRCNITNGGSQFLYKYSGKSKIPTVFEVLDANNKPAENEGVHKFHSIHTKNDSVSFVAFYNSKMFPVAAKWLINMGGEMQLFLNKGEFYTTMEIEYDHISRLKTVKYYDVYSKPVVNEIFPYESRYVYENEKSKCPLRIDHYNASAQIMCQTIMKCNASSVTMTAIDSRGIPITTDFRGYKDEELDESLAVQITLLYKQPKNKAEKPFVRKKTILDNNNTYMTSHLSVLQHQLSRQVFNIAAVGGRYESSY